MAITHIHGDTFDYSVPLPVEEFPDGYFIGWNIASQVRTERYATLVATLDCTWADPVTTRTIKLFNLSTIDWPVVPCVMDIQFTRVSDGYVFSSSVESVNVVKDVTDTSGPTP